MNRRVSAPEKAVGTHLEAAGLRVVSQWKVRRWTFDFYLPDSGVAVEVDGAFWHSRDDVRARDARKEAWCRENGVLLIRVPAEFTDVRAACEAVIDGAAERLAVL